MHNAFLTLIPIKLFFSDRLYLMTYFCAVLKLNQVKTGFPHSIESIEFQTWFSRPLKSIELGQNVHKVLKKYRSSKSKRNQSISEQNFTEGKAVHCLCSVMQCVKLNFMIRISKNEAQ